MRVTDYYYVDCEEYREALSARLDNEEPEESRQPTDQHLECCVECALWYDNAALITRRSRTTLAVSWPDVTDAVMARVPAGVSRRSTRLRVTLGVVAAVQGVSALVSLAVPDSAVGYEAAAWQLALAVTLGIVAQRGTRPAGLVPLLGIVVGALSVGHVTGLSPGEPTPGGVLSYALTALALVLVTLLGRIPSAPNRPVPPATSAGRKRSDTDDDLLVNLIVTEPTKAA